MIILLKNKYRIILDKKGYSLFKKYNWYINTPKPGYHRLVRHIGNKKIKFFHRELINAPKNKMVDHKNGNPLDNRISNLRICTRSQNAMNSKLTKKKKTKGVYQLKDRPNLKKRFFSRIYYRKKFIFLGYFMTEIEAAKAYDQAAKKYFKKFAKYNLK